MSNHHFILFSAFLSVFFGLSVCLSVFCVCTFLLFSRNFFNAAIYLSTFFASLSGTTNNLHLLLNLIKVTKKNTQCISLYPIPCDSYFRSQKTLPHFYMWRTLCCMTQNGYLSTQSPIPQLPHHIVSSPIFCQGPFWPSNILRCMLCAAQI